MVYATGDKIGPHRLRVGMVGGGRNAFIGAVHRMALRLDDRAELVAGALSSDPENARLSGLRLGEPHGGRPKPCCTMQEPLPTSSPKIPHKDFQ